jgi:hypothetical protein
MRLVRLLARGIYISGSFAVDLYMPTELWRSLVTGSAVLPHQICHRIALKTQPFPTSGIDVRQ